MKFRSLILLFLFLLFSTNIVLAANKCTRDMSRTEINNLIEDFFENENYKKALQCAEVGGKKK